MAYMLCVTHVWCVSLNYVVDYSALLFVILEVHGFISSLDTVAGTEDLHGFIQFSKEKTQE